MTRARDLSNDEANGGGATPPFVAGKNQCINGAFNVWQRGTSFSSNVYTADRWTTQTNKTLTVSQQAFTAGTAPVAGYEGTFFLRQTYSADGSYGALQTKLEDVRLFAGQTITFSYWAKADATYSNTPSINQNFGSGGSSGVTTNGTTHNITTTWARYSSTITVPSISGKTIGTSNFFLVQPILIESSGARTIDIWGVQIESGSVATPFTPAGGGFPGAELALCQRYYWRANSAGAVYTIFSFGYTDSTTTALITTPVPSYMRVFPTSVDYANLAFQEAQGGIFTFAAISLNGGSGATASNNNIQMQITGASGMTIGRPGRLLSNGVTNGHLGFSAEL
jgi:hypothetical protein